MNGSRVSLKPAVGRRINVSNVMHKRRQMVHACVMNWGQTGNEMSHYYLLTPLVDDVSHFFVCFSWYMDWNAWKKQEKLDQQATDIVLHLTTRIPVIVSTCEGMCTRDPVPLSSTRNGIHRPTFSLMDSQEHYTTCSFQHSSVRIRVQSWLYEDERMVLVLCNISSVSMETVWNGAMVNLPDRHTCRAVCLESCGLCQLMFSWYLSWNSPIIPSCFPSSVGDVSRCDD